MKIGVVGGGIAGLNCALALSEINGVEVTLFDGEFHLGASHSSTGIVSSFGTRRGISPWGDTLLDSYEYSLSFYDQFSSAINGTHFHLKSEFCDEDEFNGRFGHLEECNEGSLGIPIGPQKSKAAQGFKEPCLILCGDRFRREILRGKRFNIENRFVLSLDELDHFDFKVICQGNLRNEIPLGKNLKNSKSRKGTYLLWEDMELNSLTRSQNSYRHNLHLDFFKGFYLSYRWDWKQLVLGTSNASKSDYLGDIRELKELYKVACRHFRLPDFSKAKIRVGIRDLNSERKGKLEEIDSATWALTGLYKNGWTLAPYFANKLKSKIIERLVKP